MSSFAVAATAVRLERLQVVEAVFPAPLPLDAAAARRYGSMVELALEKGRAPRSPELGPPS